MVDHDKVDHTDKSLRDLLWAHLLDGWVKPHRISDVTIFSVLKRAAFAGVTIETTCGNVTFAFASLVVNSSGQEFTAAVLDIPEFHALRDHMNRLADRIGDELPPSMREDEASS